MTDVAALMKHSEVRSDLLDDIPTDCGRLLELELFIFQMQHDKTHKMT